jgi:hypothetical protein
LADLLVSDLAHEMVELLVDLMDRSLAGKLAELMVPDSAREMVDL